MAAGGAGGVGAGVDQRRLPRAAVANDDHIPDPISGIEGSGCHLHLLAERDARTVSSA
jgi:hypothetical protein